MTVNQMIIDVVSPIVPKVYPDNYNGEEPEYCVFNCSEYPDLFGDDAPTLIRYAVMLHYFLPLGKNPISVKKKIQKALYDAGCTYPTVTNATDNEYQHYVFEFEYIDENVFMEETP